MEVSLILKLAVQALIKVESFEKSQTLFHGSETLIFFLIILLELKQRVESMIFLLALEAVKVDLLVIEGSPLVIIGVSSDPMSEFRLSVNKKTCKQRNP